MKLALFLYVLFAGLCCLPGFSADGGASSSAGAARIHDLKPSDLYLKPVLKHDASSIKLIREAKVFFDGGDFAAAKPLLEKAAEYGHLNSILLLGDIYRGAEQNARAYLWYRFAFQEEWSKNKKHLPGAVERFTPEFLGPLPETLKGGDLLTQLRRNLYYPVGGSAQEDQHLEDFGLESLEGKGRFNVVDKLESARFFLLSKTSSSFLTLAHLYQSGLLPGGIDIEKAAEYYEKSEESAASYALGMIYFSGTLQGGNNYVKAAECFTRSELPGAKYALGLIHHEGKLTGQPNFAEAAACYLAAKTAEAYNNLGTMYARGYLGEDSRWEQAEKYYKLSNHPAALWHLGNIFSQGNLPGGIEKAVQWWEKSKTADSYHNIGLAIKNGLVKRGHQPEKEAIKYFKKAGHIDANMQLLELYRNTSDSPEMRSILSALEVQISEIPAKKQHLYRGQILIIQKKFSEAVTEFSEAFRAGEPKGLVYLQIMTEILDRHAAIRQAAEEVPEKCLEVSTSSSESEDETAMCAAEGAGGAAGGGARLKQAREKAPLDKKGRIAKAERKLHSSIAKALKHSNAFKSSPIVEASTALRTDGDLEIKVAPEAQEGYDALKPKLVDLLADIAVCPWGLQGIGHPEWLKANFQGCMSRRITREDRLVYQIIGPREILIVRCGGHY